MRILQSRLDGRAFLLSVCVLCVGAACSVLVDTQRQQCATDDDCARHGAAYAGFVCLQSVCTSPAGSGGTSAGGGQSSGGNDGGNAGSSVGGSPGSGGAVGAGGSTVDRHDSSVPDSPDGSSAQADFNLQDTNGNTVDGSRWSDWNAFLPLASGSTTNGDPGTTPDVSGNGYAATYGRGVSFSKSALVMAGSGDVSISSQASVPAIDITGSYSVSVWVTMTATTAWRTFVSADGNQVSEFYLQKRSDTNHFAFTLSTADSDDGVTQPCVASSSIAPSSGTLYHLVATRDATTGVDTLYVDGVAAGTATCPVSIGAGWPARTFGIGHGMYTGSFTDYFAGSISGLGLVGRALTDAEVSALYALGPG